MKKMICILLSLILMLGVCGCMNNEPNGTVDLPQPDGSDFAKLDLDMVEESVLSHLGKKYGEIFEMDQLTLEFGGQDIYYRAVFHSTRRPDQGVLYCRSQGEGSSVKIDGVDCFLTDDYANVILQTGYAEALQAELGQGVMVKCQLRTPDRMLTDDEFAAGVQACLQNAELMPHLFVYVFTDKAGPDAELKARAEEYVGRVNGFRQYLYIVHQTGAAPESWESRYYDNISDFEGYLLHRSEAEVVDYTAFELDKGIVKQTVIER